jgi:hypothetical protein
MNTVDTMLTTKEKGTSPRPMVNDMDSKCMNIIAGDKSKGEMAQYIF